ncbi:MAG: PAS domain S-box protein, partial [Acidimicrobiales bacterium]
MTPRDRPPVTASSSARARLARHVLVGFATLLVVAVVALLAGRANLDTAIDQQVEDRANLVERFSQAGEALLDPEPLVDQLASLPFTPENPTRNRALLEHFFVGPSGDPHLAVGLVDRELDTLASLSGEPIAAPEVSEAVAEAIGGEPGLSPVFEHGDQLAWARTLPVGDEPWAALVLIEDLEAGSLQRLYSDLGALGRGDGGLSLVDSEGRAAASWDADLLGQPVLTAAELERLGATPSTWTTEAGDRTILNIGASRRGPHAGTALVFQQDEATFTADARAAQRQRDRAVIAVAALSILVLLVFTLVRQRGIKRAERRARVILEATDDIVMVLEAEGSIRAVSAALERLLGQDGSTWIGRQFHELVAPDERDRVDALIDTATEAGQAEELGVRLLHRDGTVRWFDIDVVDRRDEPSVTGLVATCSDVGERHRLETELTYRATHDPLTGLANRSGFDARLNEIAATARTVAVAAIDLDRFKPLNDTVGHDAGDEALRTVAAA